MLLASSEIKNKRTEEVKGDTGDKRHEKKQKTSF